MRPALTTALALGLSLLGGEAQASVLGRLFGRAERRESSTSTERSVRAAPALRADESQLGSSVERQDLGAAGVRYRIGTGAPRGTLVFLHGWGGAPGGELFDRLAEGIATSGGSFTAVAPWLRARGDPAAPHTMSGQLALARAAIAALPGPVVLVGHSFGGKAALALAKELPSKVVGVVGLAPSVNMAHAYWKGLTGERGLPSPARMLETYAVEEHKLEAELAALPETDSERAHEIRSALADLRFQKDLARYDEPALESHLATPTLVFHGTEDGAVSIHYARRFAETNADRVRLVELPGEGHGLADAVGAIASEVTAFADARFASSVSRGQP